MANNQQNLFALSVITKLETMKTMKRFIFSALILIIIGITIASCTAKSQKNYMIFSGEIANHNKKINKIQLLNSNGIIYEMLIHKNGSFSDTLKIKTGYYTFYYDNKGTLVYLNKTNDLKLFFTKNDLIGNYRMYINKFEGEDAAINTYLQKKEKEFPFPEGDSMEESIEFGKLSGKEYLSKVQDWKNKIEKTLKTSGIKNKFFLELESKRIYYYYLSSFFGHNDIYKKSSYMRELVEKEIEKFNFSDTLAYDYDMYDHYHSCLQAVLSFNLVDYEKKEEKRLGRSLTSIESHTLWFKKSYLPMVTRKITSVRIKDDEIYRHAVMNLSLTKKKSDIDEGLYKMVFNCITDKSRKKELEKAYKKRQNLFLCISKGKKSPTFKSYENYKGGITSLDDFKGQYVYMSLWAPC
jgi:hypothetical protein